MSCHHNALAVMTLRRAHDRGSAIDVAAPARLEARTFETLRGATAPDDAIQGVHVSEPTPNDTYLLMAAEAAGLPPVSPRR